MLFRKINKLLKLLYSSTIYIKPLLGNVAAAVEHQELLKNLNLNSLVDIGANKGQFSLVSYAQNQNICINAFEPLPGPALKFESIFQGKNNVRLHQFAISDTDGEAKIHISASEDSSSLLPIGPLQNQIFPGTEEVGTVIIQTRRLESVLPESEIRSPSMLKIDVQGFELSALAGCELMLRKFDFIYVECSFVELYVGQACADQIIAFLQQHDFILNGIYNAQYAQSGAAVQADFLFEKVEPL